MAIQRKEFDQHGYNKFINIQQKLMTYTKDIGNFEDKIELIREKVTTEILKCPEKEVITLSRKLGFVLYGFGLIFPGITLTNS